jgi:hypothetical protein
MKISSHFATSSSKKNHFLAHHISLRKVFKTLAYVAGCGSSGAKGGQARAK